MLAALEPMKPGPVRDALMLQLDAKLREKGAPLDDPEQLDALAGLMFQRILEDMAAPGEVWTWEGDDAPRGDVLIREKLLLFPGRVSSELQEGHHRHARRASASIAPTRTRRAR